MKNIIAIVGMCGSGKSVATDILESMGYKKVYFGGVTMEKLKEANLEINETNEKMMREGLRKELGMGAYAKILLPRIIEYSKEANTVLDGLYSWDEYKILMSELGSNFKMIAIIADKEIRYERLSKRNIRPLDREIAIKRDLAEIENLAKGGPISYADYFIFNNGTVDEYKIRLNEILEDLERNKKNEHIKTRIL